MVLPAPSGPCSSMKASRSARRGGQRRGGGGAGGLVGASAACGFLESADERCSAAFDGAGAARATARLGRGARILPDRRRRCGPVVAPSRACWRGCATASTARWTTWPRHGLKRARPAELVPGTVRVITARMDYLPRATPDGWQAIEWQRLARPARRPRCRSTPAAATITRCCARACSSWPSGWPARSARSATASSPIRRRCSRSSWPRAAASAGAASTRWRCTARPARCSSSARSTSTWRCR